jgi:GxxExxY protein
MNSDELRCPDLLTEKVLGAVFERALLHELKILGIRAASQASFDVVYKGQRVGEYFADILAEDVLVIELKCVERFANEHIAQCINYLRASGRNVCLLIDFQRPKVEWKRVVYAEAGHFL